MTENDDRRKLTSVDRVPLFVDDFDVTHNDDLRELIEEWRDKIEPVGGMEQRHQTLSDCADQLEELIEDE